MLNHKGTETIYTERLVLRQYKLSDAKCMYKNYAGDERVTKFLLWEPYKNDEETKPYLQSIISQYKNQNVYEWAIEYQRESIGGISAMSVNDIWKNCEVGYCIGYDYWNQGIASEALAAVIKFMFDEVRLHRIMAKHNEKNPASGKVMKKCHMNCEGRMKEYYVNRDGMYSDCLVYGIVC